MDESDSVPVKRAGLLSDDDGFAAFYGACRTEVARALILAIGDRDLGSEAADEAFARALERWADVKDYENPEGWVLRVGLNWAKSRLRRRSVPTSLLDDGHHVDELPEPELLEAVEQLSFDHRSVVVARFFLDWSIQHTAEALDLPEGTVKSRQVRAPLTKLSSGPPPKPAGSKSEGTAGSADEEWASWHVSADPHRVRLAALTGASLRSGRFAQSHKMR